MSDNNSYTAFKLFQCCVTSDHCNFFIFMHFFVNWCLNFPAAYMYSYSKWTNSIMKGVSILRVQSRQAKKTVFNVIWHASALQHVIQNENTPFNGVNISLSLSLILQRIEKCQPL